MAAWDDAPIIAKSPAPAWQQAPVIAPASETQQPSLTVPSASGPVTLTGDQVQQYAQGLQASPVNPGNFQEQSGLRKFAGGLMQTVSSGLAGSARLGSKEAGALGLSGLAKFDQRFAEDVENFGNTTQPGAATTLGNVVGSAGELASGPVGIGLAGATALLTPVDHALIEQQAGKPVDWDHVITKSIAKAGLEVTVNKLFQMGLTGKAVEGIFKNVAPGLMNDVGRIVARAGLGAGAAAGQTVGENQIEGRPLTQGLGTAIPLGIGMEVGGGAIHDALTGRTEAPKLSAADEQAAAAPAQPTPAAGEPDVPPVTQAETPAKPPAAAAPEDTPAAVRDEVGTMPEQTAPTKEPMTREQQKAGLMAAARPGEVIHGADASNLESMAKNGIQPSELSGTVDAEQVPEGGFGKDVPSTAASYAMGARNKNPILVVLKPHTNRGTPDDGLVRHVVATSDNSSYVKPEDIAGVIFPDGERLNLPRALKRIAAEKTPAPQMKPELQDALANVVKRDPKAQGSAYLEQLRQRAMTVPPEKVGRLKQEIDAAFPGTTRRSPKAPETPAPPVEPPVEQPTGQDENGTPITTSARKVDMDRDRAALGLDELPSPARHSWQSALVEAARSGIPDKAMQLADEVNTKPRSLSDTETAGMVIRAVQLKNEHAAAIDRVAQATDPADIQTASADALRIEQDFDQLSRALRVSGTEKGRALAAQKLTLDKDFRLLSVLKRAKATKGAELTPDERQRLTDLTKQHDDVTKQLDETKKKLDRQEAQKNLRKSGSRYDRMTPEQRDAERDQLLEKLKADPSDAKSLAKLAQNIGSRPGMGNIQQVEDWMVKNLPTVERQHIVDALNDAAKAAQEKTEIQKQLADLKKEAKDDTSLRSQIDELSQHLENGTLPEPKPNELGQVDQPIVAALRALRNKLSDEVKNSPQAQKARLVKQIKRLEQRLKEGVKPKPPLVPEPLRAQFDELTYKRDRLQARIRQAIAAGRPKSVWSRIAEPLNTTRAIIASTDLSAVLRQGGFIAIAHPIRASRSLLPMLQAFGSERAARRIQDEILSRPNALLYAKTKLYLSPIFGESSITAKEEAFMSRWVEKLPLIKNSERAYVLFLNKLRADSFDTMVGALSRNGEPTLKEARAVANFINVATGRGSLGGLERSAHAMNTLFFAPRYVTSRFELLAGQPLYGGSARTRAMVATEYARYLVGMGTLYALASASGASVTFDPRSSDFGKMKWGDARLDPLSGLSQVAVLAGRVVTGQKVSSITGEVAQLRGTTKFGAATTFDVLAQFIRTKLSPVFSTPVDLATGTDMLHQPVTPASMATNLVVPLQIRDVYQAVQQQGLPAGTALSLVSIFGMGLQIYGMTPKKAKNTNALY